MRADYACERGIPLSEFLGWDEADQDAALLWMMRRRQVHSCGTHPDDWDEDAGGDRDAWHAEIAVCPGCQKLDQVQADLEARRSAGEVVHGARVFLRPGPPVHHVPA